MKKTVLAALLCGFSAVASAAFVDGNMLLERLRQPDSGMGTAYILGTIDSESTILQMLRDKKISPPGTFPCLPNDVTAGQLKDVVKKFLEETPQHRHHPAYILISVALEKAFPCK